MSAAVRCGLPRTQARISRHVDRSMGYLPSPLDLIANLPQWYEWLGWLAIVALVVVLAVVTESAVRAGERPTGQHDQPDRIASRRYQADRSGH